MASSSESGRLPWLPEIVKRFGRATWRLTSHTLGASIRYRVTGLAAEAAFFTILSLPPLIFALAGAVGYVAQRYDVHTIADFREQVLDLSSRALTPVAVDSVIAPTVDDVLSGGRFDIISIGFVIALWSGSRALNVFVDTITIMYGLGGHRGIVRTRMLSFGLYLVFLLVGVVVLPLVLAGPTLVDRVLPPRLSAISSLYWPVVLISSVFVLATLYHLAVPVRTRLRANLPGALLTLLIWLLGSYLLRIFLGQSIGGTSIYGPLAAPIAMLIWLYVISLAILAGAAFNAAADEVWPRLSGIHSEAEAGEPDGEQRAAGEPDTKPDTEAPDAEAPGNRERRSRLLGRTGLSARARARAAQRENAELTAAQEKEVPTPLPGPGTAAELRARERDPD